MAISSGLSSQLGYVAETTYGTAVTVTKFPRHNSAAFTRTASRVQGMGIQSGVFGPVAAHYIEATAAGEGTIELDVQDKGLLPLLKVLMGSGATGAPSGSAYTHTFTLADPVGLSLTCQVGRPTRGGTVVPQTAAGCKVTSAEFSCQTGELLTGSFSIDAQKVENTTALATASYLTGSTTFHGGLMALKMGTYSSESAVSGVRGVSISINRPMDTEDYTTVNNTAGVGYKAEPVINDFAEITGTVTADWLAKATFEDLANANTGTSLVWEFVGTTAISGSDYPTFRITLPSVYFDSGSQSVDGVNELTNDWNFSWKYNGSNLPTIVVKSAETAI